MIPQELLLGFHALHQFRTLGNLPESSHCTDKSGLDPGTGLCGATTDPQPVVHTVLTPDRTTMSVKHAAYHGSPGPE